MIHEILLVTAADDLAERVEKVLRAPALQCRLSRARIWAPQLRPQSPLAHYRLVLLDERLVPAESNWASDGESDAAPPSAPLTALPTIELPPVVLLTQGGASRGEAFRSGAVDAVNLARGLSTLVYVVRQQLAAVLLHRLRLRQELEDLAELPANGFSLRHEINNPLAGILGNAELALTGRMRLSPEARQRFQRIFELGQQIQDLLASPQARALPIHPGAAEMCALPAVESASSPLASGLL